MLKPRHITAVVFILFAALIRILPHPWNFTPIGAMALFGGAHLQNKKTAFLFPLAALLLSDLILGSYHGMWVIYTSFLVIVAIGWSIRNDRRPLPVAVATLAASVSFFVLTNFGTWALESLYPKTFGGLEACYIAGIPFFRNTLASDAFYVMVLFGGFALAERWFPVLRELPAAPAHSAA